MQHDILIVFCSNGWCRTPTKVSGIWPALVASCLPSFVLFMWIITGRFGRVSTFRRVVTFRGGKGGVSTSGRPLLSGFTSSHDFLTLLSGKSLLHLNSVVWSIDYLHLSLVVTSDASTRSNTIILFSSEKQPWHRHKHRRKHKHKDQNFSFFLCLHFSVICNKWNRNTPEA